MRGIYVMAVFTTIWSAVFLGGWLYAVAGPRKRYLAFLLASLGFSPLVNLLVKAPLARALGLWFGVPPGLRLETPWWFLLVLHFLSPVTEEAAKLVPAVISCACRPWRDRAGALVAGGALGLGFGLSEIGYLAWRVAGTPAMAGYQWYWFTFFAWERGFACVLHIVCTGVAASGLTGGFGRALGSYGAAVLLHAVGNLSAMMYQLGLWGVTAHTIYLAGVILALTLAFERLRRKAGAAQPRGEGELVIYRRGDG